MSIIEATESEVRSYCRSFPKEFSRSKGCYIYDVDGNAYLDFLAGCGALNYGHNNEYIMQSILEYIKNDGITHAMDMTTAAKCSFLVKFKEKILDPRGLDYKVMFCGPTGTNAVEASLKLARKVTGRSGVFAFMGAFHGMTLGSLAVTSNKYKRGGAGLPLDNVTFMPFPYRYNNTFDTIGYIRNVLEDDHSGIEAPAAIIVETTQAEGGIVVADTDWLRRLRELCDEFGILLICDEIQVGCGRTGTFFSFERAGIVPDIVTVAKSISGSGLPMAVMLMKPELDIWMPGEHNGTFRGNQLAFVGASAALDCLEKDNILSETVRKGEMVSEYIKDNIISKYPKITERGIGLIRGIDFSGIENGAELCKEVAKECFTNGLIIERAGRGDEVLKILPPLVITDEELTKGLEIIRVSMEKVLG